MTHVVIFIMASDKHVKKSNSGLPLSPIMARVMPRTTDKEDESMIGAKAVVHGKVRLT